MWMLPPILQQNGTQRAHKVQKAKCLVVFFLWIATAVKATAVKVTVRTRTISYVICIIIQVCLLRLYQFVMFFVYRFSFIVFIYTFKRQYKRILLNIVISNVCLLILTYLFWVNKNCRLLTIFLYKKQNTPRLLRSLVSNILFNTRNKFHISAQPNNILYLFYCQHCLSELHDSKTYKINLNVWCVHQKHCTQTWIQSKLHLPVEVKIILPSFNAVFALKGVHFLFE